MRQMIAKLLIMVMVVGTGAVAVGDVALAASTQVATGRDGRLTILLLGTDRRASLSGERTDSMMIVSIDARTHRPVAVSIPRDTARFPNALRYTGKVNNLFERYLRTRTRKASLQSVKRDFAAALGIEIDYVVAVKFYGFSALIDRIGGIDLRLTQRYSDIRFQWALNGHRHVGITFPAGLNHLNGARALMFARSRKGCCPGNGDFGRAVRQQAVILATIRKVSSRGIGALPALVSLAHRAVETDVPWTAAAGVFSLVSHANTAITQAAILKPSTFASHIAGTTSYQLNMAATRAYMRKWFGPVH